MHMRKWSKLLALAGLFALYASTCSSATTASAGPTKNAGYTVAGCPMFPGTPGGTSGGWFNTDIAGVAPDPNSAAYIAAYAAVNNTGFTVYPNPLAYENFVTTSSAPLQPIVASKHSAHYVPWAMPWGTQVDGSPMQIENAGTDGHYTTLVTDTCTLYEAGYTKYSQTNPSAVTPGEFNVYNSGRWNTRAPFSTSLQGTATADATGIPLTALAITPEQIASGRIAHALGWGAIGCEGTMPMDPFTVVAPALVYGGCAHYGGRSDATPMPYGSHIRLKASVDTSTWGPAAQAIATALKTYGAYMYDTGCCNEFYAVRDIAGPHGPVIPKADNAELGTLRITDFDVISPRSSNAP